jgi:hypothetical protein
MVIDHSQRKPAVILLGYPSQTQKAPLGSPAGPSWSERAADQRVTRLLFCR